MQGFPIIARPEIPLLPRWGPVVAALLALVLALLLRHAGGPGLI